MKKSVDIVRQCGTVMVHQTKESFMSTEFYKDRAEYVRDNRDKFAHYAARQRDKLKLEMVEAYGGKCVACGVDEPIVLCLDHIHDDAEVERIAFGLNARGGHKNYSR